MCMRVEVLSIGDINIDIITSPIPSLPEKETSYRLDYVGLYTGGNAANFAASSASLGLKTGFIGLLGVDVLSRWLIEKMESYGVNCYIKQRDDVFSGVTISLTYSDGLRQFLATWGSNEFLSLEDFDVGMVKEAKHMHRSGLWWGRRMLGEPNLKLFKYASTHEVQTSLDIGPRNPSWTLRENDMIFDLLRYVDVLFANEEEIRFLAQKNKLKDCCKLCLEAGAKLIVLHLGGRGSMAFTKDVIVKGQAYDVKPLNPTGTGDVYNAAFVYGLIKGWNLNKSIDFANAAAAVHLTRVKPTYPTISSVYEFMKCTPKRKLKKE